MLDSQCEEKKKYIVLKHEILKLLVQNTLSHTGANYSFY